jgi:hypothetical protein
VAELADNDPSPSPYNGIGLKGAVASDPLPYTLHLLPAIRDGAAPVVFPQGACIDLDGSKIPPSWRNIDASKPYGPIDSYSNDVRPMDLLFTAQGTVYRDLLLEGFLHFRIARTSDIIDARNKGTLPSSKPTYPIIVRDPEYAARVVSLTTQTGSLRVSEVFTGTSYTPLDQTPNNETIPTWQDAFRYAIRGREAKQ